MNGRMGGVDGGCGFGDLRDGAGWRGLGLLRKGLVVFGVTVLTVGMVPRVWSEPEPDEVLRQLSCGVRRVFDEARPAVVQIEARDGRGTLRCTGFFVDPFGTLYTLAGVAAEDAEVHVIQGGKRTPAEVLVADARSGVAILRSEPGEHFLTPCARELPEVAEPVVLVGYPLEFDLSPAFGVISGRDRKIGGRYFSTTHLRANVPVMRGQGGAPLLNLEGRVVGIVMASVDGGASCHALPIAAAEKLRRDWRLHGEVRHGWMGVHLADVEEARMGSRAVVDSVDPGSPAAAAGVKPGDIVLRVGAWPVTQKEDALDASFFLTAGETAWIEVLRDGEVLRFEAEAGPHPLSHHAPRMEQRLTLFCSGR